MPLSLCCPWDAQISLALQLCPTFATSLPLLSLWCGCFVSCLPSHRHCSSWHFFPFAPMVSCQATRRGAWYLSFYLASAPARWQWFTEPILELLQCMPSFQSVFDAICLDLCWLLWVPSNPNSISSENIRIWQLFWNMYLIILEAMLCRAQWGVFWICAPRSCKFAVNAVLHKCSWFPFASPPPNGMVPQEPPPASSYLLRTSTYYLLFPTTYILFTTYCYVLLPTANY